MKGRQNSFSMLAKSAPTPRSSSLIRSSPQGWSLSSFFSFGVNHQRSCAQVSGSTHPGGVTNKQSKMGQDVAEARKDKEGVSKTVDAAKLQQQAAGDKNMPESIQAMSDPVHVVFRDESTDFHLVSEQRERARHDPQQADFAAENSAAGDAIMYREVTEEEELPLMTTESHSAAKEEAKEFNKMMEEQKASQKHIEDNVRPKFAKQAEAVDSPRETAGKIHPEESAEMDAEKLKEDMKAERDKAKAEARERSEINPDQIRDVWH